MKIYGAKIQKVLYILAKMSVFLMARNLTIGHATEKDYLQPFTVMAEEHPPSPEQKGVPYAREIAGQARDDGFGVGFCRFCVN